MALPVTFVAGDVLEAAQLNSNFTYLDGADGLTLVKTQVIGTTVASVAVTDAFSSTYDNYKIIVSGGVSSTSSNIGLQLGATTTGYYLGVPRVTYSSAAVTGLSANNGANFVPISVGTSAGFLISCDVINPNLAQLTYVTGHIVHSVAGGYGGSVSGFVDNSTAYTGFTIIPATGTITGGTIRVYGYKN
jgi:hypothetical protein